MNIKAKIQGAYKSFTIWFNGIVGTILAGAPMLQENLPQLHSYIPENFFKYIMLLVVVVNILLRFKTNTGLDNK